MIEVIEKPIEVATILQSVVGEEAGALVHFIGTVRKEGGISGLFYECYPEMARKTLEEISDAAKERWPLFKISVVHRTGWVKVGEPSVVIAIASVHRKEAFEACRFVIDQIKERVPIWKSESRNPKSERNSNFDIRASCFPDITGVILAGGRSSRFGSNKAFAPFQGIPLIDRVLNVMGPLFPDLMIVTNTPEIYERLHLPLVKDFEPYLGPLGGIFTALRQATSDRIFVVACDMPLLDSKVISEIIRRAGEADAAVPIHDGLREFLMAVYSRKLLPEIGKSLGEGRLSIKEFCLKVPAIEWIPIQGSSSVAINTPEDLEKLEERYAR